MTMHSRDPSPLQRLRDASPFGRNLWNGRERTASVNRFLRRLANGVSSQYVDLNNSTDDTCDYVGNEISHVPLLQSCEKEAEEKDGQADPLIPVVTL